MYRFILFLIVLTSCQKSTDFNKEKDGVDTRTSPVDSIKDPKVESENDIEEWDRDTTTYVTTAHPKHH